jgi:hypothetical protein
MLSRTAQVADWFAREIRSGRLASGDRNSHRTLCLREATESWMRASWLRWPFREYL